MTVINRPEGKKPTLYAVLLVGAVAWTPAQGQGTGDDVTILELRAGYGRTDNVLRADTETLDSGVLNYGVRVDWSVDRPIYRLDVVGDLDRLNYSEDAINDRYAGDLDGRLDVKLAGDSLVWWVADTFSQLRENIDLADSPDNLRDINVIGTGVDANVALSDRMSVGASGHVNNRSVDQLEDLDSEETAFSAGLFRQMSTRSRIGIVFGQTQVSYDQGDASDYDIDRGYLSYSSTLASGAFYLDAGANRAKNFAAGQDDDWRPLIDLSWTRAIAARSQLSISVSHRMVDLGSSLDFGEEPALGTSRSGELVATQSPFDATDIAVSILTEGTISGFGIGLHYANQEFLDNVIPDNNVFGIDVRWHRDLGEQTVFGIDSFVGRRTDSLTDFEATDYRVGLRLARDIGQRLRATLGYHHRGRNANNGSDYQENYVRIDVALVFAR